MPRHPAEVAETCGSLCVLCMWHWPPSAIISHSGQHSLHIWSACRLKIIKKSNKKKKKIFLNHPIGLTWAGLSVCMGRPCASPMPRQGQYAVEVVVEICPCRAILEIKGIYPGDKRHLSQFRHTLETAQALSLAHVLTGLGLPNIHLPLSLSIACFYTRYSHEIAQKQHDFSVNSFNFWCKISKKQTQNLPFIQKMTTFAASNSGARPRKPCLSGYFFPNIIIFFLENRQP